MLQKQPRNALKQTVSNLENQYQSLVRRIPIQNGIYRPRKQENSTTHFVVSAVDPWSKTYPALSFYFWRNASRFSTLLMVRKTRSFRENPHERNLLIDQISAEKLHSELGMPRGYPPSLTSKNLTYFRELDSIGSAPIDMKNIVRTLAGKWSWEVKQLAWINGVKKFFRKYH